MLKLFHHSFISYSSFVICIILFFSSIVGHHLLICLYVAGCNCSQCYCLCRFHNVNKRHGINGIRDEHHLCYNDNFGNQYLWSLDVRPQQLSLVGTTIHSPNTKYYMSCINQYHDSTLI